MVGAVGTAHSCSNPNTTVWNSKGIWLTYILMILFLHFTLLSIPGNDFKQLYKIPCNVSVVRLARLYRITDTDAFLRHP